MTGQKLKKFKSDTRHVAAILASSAILTAGCANMATTAVGGSNGFGSAAITTTGNVHGGNQPVAFARVELYGVGQKGAGSPANLLATAFTNASGTFQFNKTASGTYPNTGNTYACPSGADQLLYVKVDGGNTQGTGGSEINNSASIFLSPIGFCTQITNSTSVNVSEVTTAATVAAAAQFINPTTESIGADGVAIEYVAIANSFKLVNTLVDQATGLSKPSSTIAPVAGGLNNSTVSMTATPEAAKLNTIANILSSCINQVSATSANNCSTLFANATPPPDPTRTSQPTATYPTATDTLQAALYMFLNPTDGSTAARTNLYNLSPGTGAPYQPTITSVPTDWSIAVAYSTTNTCGTTAANFFSNPYDLGVDINGNIWISNGASNGSLTEISNTGEPATCATLNATGIAGGQIDINGNVWMGDSGFNRLYRFTPAGSLSVSPSYPANSVRTYNTAGSVLAVTSDGAGNVFYTVVVNGVGQVYRIDFGAGINGVNPPTLISNTVGSSPARMFPDKSGDLFVTSGAGYVTELNPAPGGTNYLNGYTSTQINGIPSPTFGVVVGPLNRVYITSQDPGASLTVLAPSGSSYIIQPGFPTTTNVGGLSNPAGIWIDGQQTTYVANNLPETGTGLYALSVVDINGKAVSASGNSTGGYQKSLVYFNAMRNTVVDSSGNVWVTNENNPSSITEVIGLGVQIYAPYSVGLQNGRFQTQP
jgi:hypothetical protein